MIDFIAVIAAPAAVLFAALWWRARRRNPALVGELFDAAPIAAFRWRRDGAEAIALGHLPGDDARPSYAGFLAGLDRADAGRVAEAVEQLRRAGTAFAAEVAAGSGGAYGIAGQRTAGGDSVLWLADASGTRRAEEARGAAVATAAALRAMLDAMPLPAWRRDRELRLVDCNTACAAMLDLPREALLAQPADTAGTTAVIR